MSRAPRGGARLAVALAAGVLAALQTAAAAPRTAVRRYENPRSHDVRTTSIVASQDGGLLGVGYGTDVGGRTGDVVSRWDAQGRLVGAVRVDVTFGTAVAELPDGDVIVVGNGSTRRADDAWVARLTPDLRPRWHRYYGSAGHDEFNSVAVMPDGGLVACGFTHVAPDGSDPAKPWLVRLDPAGDVAWSRVIDATEDATCGLVAALPDGGVVASGHAPWYAVWRLAADGSLTWCTKLRSDAPTALDVAPDGDIVLMGRRASRQRVTRLAPDGTVRWDRVYGNAGPTNVALGVLALDDGHVITCGNETDTVNSSSHPSLMRLDPVGDVTWAMGLGAGAARDFCGGIVDAPDGLFRVVSWYGGLAGVYDGMRHYHLEKDGSSAGTCPVIRGQALPAVNDVGDVPATDATLMDFAPTLTTGQPLSRPVPAILTDACADDLLPPTEVSNVLAGAPPLLVDDAGGRLVFETPTDATSVNLYVGDIGAWRAPPTRECGITGWTDLGDGTSSLDRVVPPGSWVLLTASNASGESPAGVDGRLFERSWWPSFQPCGP